MGVLQREYGITRQQALWEYSYHELQLLIKELPFDRLVKVGPKDTQADLERKWLESIADLDIEKIKDLKESYDEKVKKMELKRK